MTDCKLTIWLCLLTTGLLSFCSSPVNAQGEPGINVRTINGLQQRRLFDVASTYAESTLAESKQSGRERVNIIVALIDTLAQKAYQSSNPADWDAARKVAAKWESESQSPRKILISVQSTLVDQLQVERWIRELETESARPGTRDKALVAISGLVTRFRELQTEVKSLLNRRPGPREEAEWFTPNELLTLRYNIEYQQAKTLLHRAALYGKKDELNRNDVLTMVENQLKSVLRSIGPDQSLWWAVQADRIAIARTSGNFRVATQIFDGLPKSGNHSESRNLVKAEWIRTLIQRERLDDAIVVAGKESFASESPKLDLARVELFVAMSGDSNDPVWQRRALELTKSVEDTHGGYWGRLANLAVVGTATAIPETGSNLDLLIRVADEAQRKKQWNEAIKALDAAYAKAKESGQTEIAWKLGFRAASIEQSDGRHENARRRFEQLANNHSDFQKAHTGLLMACWNLTRTMGNDSSELQQYETMLGKLIECWPQSSSADQARIWLAAIRKSQKNWPAAIGLLLDVNAASPLFGKAVAELGQVSGQYMRQPDVSEESKANVRSALVVRLHTLVDVESESMPDNWPQTRAQIVALLMELKLLFGAELPTDLTQNFQRLLNDPGTPPNARLVAEALDYVRSEHSLKLDATKPGQARQLQIIYEGLLPNLDDPHLARKAGRFINAANQFATEVNQLPVIEKQRWTNATIDSLVWSNQISTALELAVDLARQRPGNAAIQIRLAELLTSRSGESAESLNKALNQWRKVAKGSRKNTGNWYKAKYFVAKLLADQGKTEDALTLLNFISAVPPGWEKAPNAQDFDTLFNSLGGK